MPVRAAENMEKKATAAKGTSSNMNKFKVCGCFSLRFKMGVLAAPEKVQQIFDKYAERGVLTPAGLQRFLAAEQQEEVTLEEAQRRLDQSFTSRVGIFNKLHGHAHALNLDDFLHFLLSPQLNGAYGTEVHHDMTLPLSHYYIYTGHNSYLTGNQLNSDCSEVPIIKALKRGVRVIELDLWPDDSNTKIQVLHGNTLTKPVDFERCIVAIRDNAFVASDFPVVITFEDHLTPELQEKAAKQTTAILKDLLYIPPDEESFQEFGSPVSLRRRILISTKPPKEYLSSGKLETKSSGQQQQQKPQTNGHAGKCKQQEEDEEPWGEEVPDFDGQVGEVGNAEEAGVKLSESAIMSSLDEQSQVDQAPAPGYKHIIGIRAGKKKGGSTKDALGVEGAVRRVSLSEPQLEKAVQDYGHVVIRFTQKNLLRIFPMGIRFNSSNYNPLIAWTHGAQMVAFNMQGYGRPLWLVHGFFRANGGCGYVKKPDLLLSTKAEVWNPRKPGPPRLLLKVTVYLGCGWYEKFGRTHFDSFSPPDFYARVGIAGVQADTRMHKTRTIEDDWHPKWEEEFDLPLTTPELALLRVEVHEYDMSDKDDFAGQTCIPVPEIRPGYRAVQLYDKKGFELTGVRLLMHFRLVDLGLPIPA